MAAAHATLCEQARLLGLRAVGQLLRPWARRQEPPTAVRRILLIRPDHLGDVLLASPALAALREALPAAQLTLLVGPWAAEVARRGAPVDEILTCAFPGFTRRPKRHLFEPYVVLAREAWRLRGRYDLAVVMRPDHWWGALLTAAAGIPLRVGLLTPGTAPFLTHALCRPDSRHVVEQSFELMRRVVELAGPDAEPLPAAPGPAVFELSDDERRWAKTVSGAGSAPLVLLHPGSGSPLKSWPPARWARVADALVEAGARVVVTGGPDDLASPRAVAALMRHEPCLLAGGTSLGQLAALAERCTLALGTDSGPMHLAAALRTPTLRLYGPTDERLFGPWPAAGEHAVLTHALPCRPCGDLVAPPCGATAEPACMLGIETERVVEAALEMLDKHCSKHADDC